MATTPNYGSTPRCGSVQVTNGDGTTAKDVANFTPPAAGTRVKEIRCHSGPTTAPGGTYTVVVLVHDGANARIVEKFSLSNAVDTRQAIFRFDSLLLPSGYKLQVQMRTTLASGATLDFIVEGEDLT